MNNKIWVNQILKNCYEYIKNYSYINLDYGNHIRIVWSCDHVVKTHNVSYIPLKNLATGSQVDRTLI